MDAAERPATARTGVQHRPGFGRDGRQAVSEAHRRPWLGLWRQRIIPGFCRRRLPSSVLLLWLQLRPPDAEHPVVVLQQRRQARPRRRPGRSTNTRQLPFETSEYAVALQASLSRLKSRLHNTLPPKSSSSSSASDQPGDTAPSKATFRMAPAPPSSSSSLPDQAYPTCTMRAPQRISQDGPRITSSQPEVRSI